MGNRVFGVMSFEKKEDLDKIVPYLHNSEYRIQDLDICVDRLLDDFKDLSDEVKQTIDHVVIQWTDDCANPTTLIIDDTFFESVIGDQYCHSGYWIDRMGEKYTDESLRDLAQDTIGREIDLLTWRKAL